MTSEIILVFDGENGIISVKPGNIVSDEILLAIFTLLQGGAHA